MNLLEIGRFAALLPYYFNEYRSRRMCRRLGRGHGYIAINRTTFFQCPSHPVAHSVFRDMAFSVQNCKETSEFLKLSTGCCSFVDVGASGGFFSILFAASRTEASTILSIEPDRGSFEVLIDLSKRNRRGPIEWKVESRGVMEEARCVEFVSSGYGAEMMGVRALSNARERAYENNLVSETFEAQCDKLEVILLIMR